MLSCFLKLVTSLFIAVAITALPMAPTALGIAAGVTCESMHALCLGNNENADLCRNSVCSLYGQECDPCQTGGAFNDPTAAIKDNNNVTILGERPYCVVICGHAWCRPLCSKPHRPLVDDMDAAAAGPSTTGLLASNDAQPDQFSIEMQQGTITIVLGDPKVNKCAWLCSAVSLQCDMRCSTGASDERQPILLGGAPPEDTVIDGLNECHVVDKGNALRAIVCAVPKEDIEPFTGQQEYNWDNTQCTLYDRQVDRRLWIACRRV